MKLAQVQETAIDPISLMKQYKALQGSEGAQELRNQLVLHYSYIAKTIAKQMKGVTSKYALVEDVEHQGIIALIDSIEKFDPSKGIKFESYAYMRVRCAVVDFIRKQDWLPRRVRMLSKRITEVYDTLSNELMREPTQKEIAQRMGVTVDKLAKYYDEISNSVMLSFEDQFQDWGQVAATQSNLFKSSEVPGENVFREELRDTLAQAIDTLTERERLVVTLYYFEDLLLSDIAKVLKVSEQRVSQINTKAVMKLRKIMNDYMKE